MKGEPRFPPAFLWAIAGVLFVAELLRRILTGHVPPDFSAYLAAADTFVRGADPYSDVLFQSPHSQGYPYVYPPGTLFVIAPLSWLSPVLASALEWMLRAGALVFSLEWIRRRFMPAVSPPAWVLGSLLFAPLVVDALAGNLTIFLLAAVVGCVAASEQRGVGRWIVTALLGMFIAFKPMWALAPAFALASRRRWAHLVALGVGGTTMLAASVAQSGLLASWMARVREVAAFYASVDLLALAPMMLPVALAVWLVVGIALVYRYRGCPPDAPPVWLWGCVSLYAWPRLAVYSYVLLIPVLAWLAGRRGWKFAAVLALPALGPVPWLLRPLAGGVYERWTYFVWCFVVAAVTARELWRAREPTST